MSRPDPDADRAAPGRCPGCGAEAAGSYCSTCGQRLAGFTLSLRALLRDFLEDQFGLTGTLPRTLAALFLTPGLLTEEHRRLRLSPYVPPLRLYLFASVLFFLVVGLRTSPIEITETQRAEIRSVRDSLEAVRAGGASTGVRFGITFDPTREDWASTVTVNLGNERLNRAVTARLMAMGDLSAEQVMNRLMRAFLEDVPKAMFLLLPVYALLLRLLHLRSGRFYAEHFVFALHVHAFYFSVFLAGVLLRWPSWFAGMCAAAVAVYTWLAMRRVFREPWWKTTAKWLGLGLAYLSVVGIAMAGAMVVAVVTG